MSVTDVVEQLRQAHALLTEARRATARADNAIEDATAVFAAATAGSTQDCVTSAHHRSTAATADVRLAHALLGQARDLLDGYCHTLAGHGLAETGKLIGPSAANTGRTGRVPASTGEESDPPALTGRYAKEIAELRKNGTKISPAKLLRMGRHRLGHLV
ncbi:hypothetical protein [Actinoalloteichus hymeniacidonis]|uniref:hypothetical protein n=1 Tax=Actinoalloteichus hymeniacidonis TaxID=340345 RepID=UPI0012FB43A2|nr:hypothetical protein [Actinoalloteichus hymeniacidonis]MBB5907296.1 hypothetical protein [Actinoalloteichus hymeniacidonis]